MIGKFLYHPHGIVRLGDFLDANLTDAKWKHFRAAVAFVKQSGVELIEAQLTEFSKRGSVKMSVGISFKGTSVEGLSLLHQTLKGRGEIWIYHNGNGSTFHPKIYLFSNNEEASVVVGSGNLTRGGLYTNYEGSFALDFHLENESDRNFLAEIEAVLDRWAMPDEGLAKKLDDTLLTKLAAENYLLPEVFTRETEEGVTPISSVPASPDSDDEAPLFAIVAVPQPPRQRGHRTGRRLAPLASTVAVSGPNVFYMTLQRTDVGRGQVRPNTQPRAAEVFIPLAARDAAPAFWDWPTSFIPDSRVPGKLDRRGVKMMIHASPANVSMMHNPVKHDFRLRSEALRSAGRVGDILKIERTDGSAGFQYQVTIIFQGTKDFPIARAACVNAVGGNSAKEWGYL